jgi:hypothetical protein
MHKLEALALIGLIGQGYLGFGIGIGIGIVSALKAVGLRNASGVRLALH